jgi:hypothetical protein
MRKEAAARIEELEAAQDHTMSAGKNILPASDAWPKQVWLTPGSAENNCCEPTEYDAAHDDFKRYTLAQDNSELIARAAHFRDNVLEQFHDSRARTGQGLLDDLIAALGESV